MQLQSPEVSVQLDRIPPRIDPDPETGTIPPACGVEGAAPPIPQPEGVWGRHPATRRSWLFLGWLLFAVLGQGERFHLDHRFRTFDRTLATYWEALRANDPETLSECMADGTTMPYPGMVWFLPPSDALHIDEIQALPVERGRMLVRYQVRYQPRGSHGELGFRTSSELVQIHGEWRIAHPIDAASIPEWRPTPGPVIC